MLMFVQMILFFLVFSIKSNSLASIYLDLKKKQISIDVELQLGRKNYS